MSDAVFVTAAGPEVGSGVRRASVCRGGVILSALVLAALMAPAFAAEEIRGRAKVVSGNEIIIGNRTIRLFGMSAPGLDDRCNIDGVEVKCGIIAWAELIKLADGRQISCDREALPPEAAAAATPKKKLVIFATCYIGEMDVNEALVRSGWASAVPEQTDRYEVDETDAKESGRGLWSNDRKRGR
jgi:endonuclease YncB( thermonuclease family)